MLSCNTRVACLCTCAGVRGVRVPGIRIGDGDSDDGTRPLCPNESDGEDTEGAELASGAREGWVRCRASGSGSAGGVGVLLAGGVGAALTGLEISGGLSAAGSPRSIAGMPNGSTSSASGCTGSAGGGS